MMDYPHWHDLAPSDQAASLHLDAMPARPRPARPTATRKSIRDMGRRRDRRLAPEDRKHNPTSQYVGVMFYRGLWVCRWSNRDGGAPADELRAALYRAAMMGLDVPQVRR